MCKIYSLNTGTLLPNLILTSSYTKNRKLPELTGQGGVGREEYIGQHYAMNSSSSYLQFRKW